jgi:hypothetical protein
MTSYLPIVLVASLLSACTIPNEQLPPKADQNYQYTFTSIGYAPIEAQPGESFDLKVLNAIKVSKLEAYKEMAEQIYGILITSNSGVQDTILMNDKIEAKVKGLVRGARVLKSYHEGNVYITELELDMQALPFLQAAEFEQQSGRTIKVEEIVYY